MLVKSIKEHSLSLSLSEFFDRENTVSHLLFSSVLLWGSVYSYKAVTIGNALFVYYRYDGDMYAFPPFGRYTREDIEIFASFIGEPFTFSPFSKKELDRFTEIYRECTPILQRSLFDYVYNTQDLISLPGSKYHAKRNHIAKFDKKYSHEYIRITKSNLSLLRDASSAIFEKDPRLPLEHKAIEFAIESFEELSLSAAVLMADGEFAAFTMGERVGDTAVIHFEKARRDIDGAYPKICSEFVKNEYPDTLFINREEDMGIEGLRKAKLSYYPAFMNEAWSVDMSDILR